MTHTKVVHHKKEPYDIFIGRPSKWANPFRTHEGRNRAEVIRMYSEWIVKQKTLMKDLHQIQGKTLGCWCKPDKSCHGDILAELADSRSMEVPRRNQGQGLFGRIRRSTKYQ